MKLYTLLGEDLVRSFGELWDFHNEAVANVERVINQIGPVFKISFVLECGGIVNVT